MTFPKYRRATTYRARIPAFSGGLNLAENPAAVKEHQLTDVENLWWKDGALCTRPGLRPVENAALSVLSLADHTTSISREHLSAAQTEGRLLMATGRFGLAQNRIESLWIDDEGGITAFSNDVAYGFSVRNLLHVTDEKSETSLGTVLTDSEQVPLLQLHTDGSVTPREPYVPTILLQVAGDDNAAAGLPAGYSFESRNLLTDAFSMECATTETGTYFHLPEEVRGKAGSVTLMATDAAGAVTHTVTASEPRTGESSVFTEPAAKRDGYRLRYDEAVGTFWLVDSADAPVTSGNTPYTTLKVTFSPAADTPDGRRLITGMRFGTWFGGDRAGLEAGTRYFVAGNPEYPHRLYYSGLSDVTYFPENNYVTVGHPAYAITALRQQGDLLVIFKEHEIYTASYASATVSADSVLQSAVIDVEAARALFPLTPVASGVGCDCPDSIALCGNRLVWATSEGKIYTLHTVNSKSERNVRELSTPIAPCLKAQGRATLRKAQGVDFDGCYGLFCGRDVFLFHYDEASFYNYSSYDAGDKPGKILAWYRWKLPEEFSYHHVFSSNGTLLFVSFVDGRAVTYRLDGETDAFYCTDVEGVTEENCSVCAIFSRFCTKPFDFGDASRRKQIKRLLVDTEADDPLAAVTVTYRTERGMDRGGTTVCGDEFPFVLHPNGMRVRRFGVMCEAMGPMKFGELTVRYEMQG